MQFNEKMKWINLTVVILFLSSCGARPIQKEVHSNNNATVYIYLDSLSKANIQLAADSLRETGGIIVLPEGSLLVVGAIRLFGGVGIVGQGTNKTILYRGEATPKDPNLGIIEINGGNGGVVRIQGIRFEGFTTENNDYKDSGIKLNNVQDFRIAYCYFENFGNSGITVSNTSWGVIDHCVFKNIHKKAIGNLGYGESVFGNVYWNETIEPGSKYATFIEDCDFYGCRHAVASNKSARYVFRHNYVADNTVSHSVDAHGPGFGSEVGTQWVEIYNNLIEKHRENKEGIMIRGGEAVVYNNTVNDHREAIVFTLDFDKKIDWSEPYPHPWQVQNTWHWNNFHNGKIAKAFVPNRSENYIQENRDYFNTPKPNYKPFQYPHPLTDEKNWVGFSQFDTF